MGIILKENNYIYLVLLVFYCLRGLKMNDKNLIPNSQRSPSELKAMTSKGGKRSGEVRRQRKSQLYRRLKKLEKELQIYRQLRYGIIQY